jgi:hypothetical protein
MPSDYTPPPRQDPTLPMLKSEHLQRLARFALIDDVPSPWGPLAGPEPVVDPTEFKND